MLTRAELMVLGDWCQARDMIWTPGRAGGDSPALLLVRARGRNNAMLLVVEAAERRLLDIVGHELAVASDLPSLLDAVDGGVANSLTPLPPPAGRAAARVARIAA